MTATPPDDPENGDATPDEFIDRRSGKDRRREAERRHGGRRHRRQPVGKDRRSGTDRRSIERRSGLDRRIYNDPRYKKLQIKRDAPSVYSTEDDARVKHILSHIGFRPDCPVCGGSFTLGPLDRRGSDTVRQVTCASCGRGTVVTNCLLVRVMVLTQVPALVKLLHTTLTGMGHEVVQPPNVRSAIRLYRENPADAVIVDTYALTEMDGQEFIRQLKMELPEPRIIVLAPRPSYRAPDPSATARHLGATQILRMPFSREDLLKAVKDAR